MLSHRPIERVAPLALILATLALFAPMAARTATPAAGADSSALRTPAPPSVAEIDGQIVRALHRMTGVIPGSDTLVDWSLFRARPQRTVDLVLPTLKPIRRGLWLGAPNMVWRIRVLQRLTGLTYEAPTRAKLARDEKARLAPDSLRQVPFAGEDPALGMTWVAPPDAQKAIIARWRQWWANDATKPELPVVKHADDRTWWY